MIRLPAEWEKQTGIWLSWPLIDTHWAHLTSSSIQEKWAEIAAIISRTQRVFINTHPSMEPQITKQLSKQGAVTNNISIYEHPNDDVWCRDHGAIFIKENDKTIATNWGFNGWGENFTPYNLDNLLPQKMAKSQGIPLQEYSEVLEGGAIESNGRGTIMTTRAVLLNSNRNPHLDQRGVEQVLNERLGAEKIIWLQDGILGDDTGGHIDDIARFVGANTVLMSTDPNGPNKASLEANYLLLRDQSDLEVLMLPMPQACEIPGWRLPTLPASYVNFLITNETVLVPTFRQPKNDDRALAMIQEQFPSREVIGIDSLDIVSEGGALHCISMQQPTDSN